MALVLASWNASWSPAAQAVTRKGPRQRELRPRSVVSAGTGSQLPAYLDLPAIAVSHQLPPCEAELHGQPIES